MANSNSVLAVKNKFDEALDAIGKHEHEIGEQIKILVDQKDWSKIEERNEYVKRIKAFSGKVLALKEEWKVLTGQVNPSAVNQSVTDVDDVLPVSERTTWEKKGDNIRVVTKKPNDKTYSNLVPVCLFVDFTETALDFIKQKGFVKTSDVSDIKLDAIRTQSNYGDSTKNLPVYATFKVLVKEGLLTNELGNSHHYTLVKNDAAVRSFLDNYIR